MNSNHPQSIIFDLDGTLSDTAQASLQACNEAARQLGLSPIEGATLRRLIGYACPELYFLLVPNQPETLVLDFGERVEIVEQQLIRRLGPAILFEGVAAMLAAFRAKGIEMHIASTGSTGHVRDVLEASGIAGFFATVSCNRPEKVAMVREIIALHPEHRWIMVGDKFKDAEAARANGIPSIGAAYGYCGPEDQVLFDDVAHSPAALLEAIS